MRLWSVLRAGLFACALAALLAPPAMAQIGSERYAAIVLDARTGNVLTAANADETRHPASLTKMMTLYMVFEALREGRLRLDSRVPFSEEAASRPPSKLGIPAGQSISVEQAILALVTRSANDVATALAERLGGSEARFAQMMTLRARALGMSRTTFRNASGLPDIEQVTTARDMATLGRRLFQDFPDRYHYFGVTHAQLGGVRLRNHNRMLESYEGVDGIKTGYINASGFNIVTSASRGGQRLIGAVFGGSSWTERDAHMATLLDRGFDQLGVAPRAEARGPTILRSASAAPLPQAARAAPRAAPRQVAARPAPRRTAARGQPARQVQARAATPRRTAHPPAARRPAPTRTAQAAPRTRTTLGTPARTAEPSLAPPVPRGAGTVRTAALR
jgi:D-alanyl-D-alanine carboxypeptidase